jgi:hypothetical protein
VVYISPVDISIRFKGEKISLTYRLSAANILKCTNQLQSVILQLARLFRIMNVGVIAISHDSNIGDIYWEKVLQPHVVTRTVTPGAVGVSSKPSNGDHTELVGSLALKISLS